MAVVGRNRPCPCGSGKKYKLCCLPKDEEQARQEGRTAAAATPPPYRVIRTTVTSPPWKPGGARRAQFLATARGEQARMLREAVDAGEVDPATAVELLASIADNDEPEVDTLLADLTAAMQAQISALIGGRPTTSPAPSLIRDALDRQEYDRVPLLLEPLAEAPERFAAELFDLAPRFMYHGQEALLERPLRRAWPVFRRLPEAAPAQVEVGRELLRGLILFRYLESTATPRFDDPALAAALNGVGKPDETLRDDVLSMLSQMPTPLAVTDFARSRQGAPPASVLRRLTFEWLGDLHRQQGVPLARGELARQALLGYLQAQLRDGVSGRQLLVPRPYPLWQKFGLQAHLGTGWFAAMAALLELLPSYCDWLGRRGLAATAEAPELLRGMSAVHAALLRWLEEVNDTADLQVLARAGDVLRAADPRATDTLAADRYPDLADLLRAGEDPEPALLDVIKQRGPAVVAPLIAIAVDERLHFADEGDPEVWAPLHAVRLLGELEAPEAVEPLLPLLDWEDDWLGEALPETYGGIGRAGLEPMRRLLFDREHDVYARARAVGALAHIGKRHPELRAEAIAALVPALEPDAVQIDQDVEVNGFVVGSLLDLHAVEALPAIERAYADGLVDTSITDYDSVLIELGLAPDPWGSGGPVLPSLTAAPSYAPAPSLAAPPSLPAPSFPKVGRNAPCPCGSGKKYKHCHGR